jgi:hypothetical protein
MTENVAREFVEKGAARAEDAYRKTQAAAGETTKVMEQTYSDFARQLTRVTSPSEFLELSTAQVRKQVETLTKQTQDLTQLAQKVTTQAAQPLQAVARTFNQSR